MNRRLVVSYVVLVAIAIAAFTVPVAFDLSRQLREDTEITVDREADTAVFLLSAEDAASRQALARLAEAYNEETPGHLDALLADGTAAVPLPLPRDPGHEAFVAALAGQKWAHWNEDGLTFALPARNAAGAVVGAVRVSYPSEPIHQQQLRIWSFRAALAVLVLIVATVIGVLLARWLTRPLRDLNQMALRLRDGDLDARAEETGPPETRTLARTLNNATEIIDTLVRSQRTFVADASHQLRTPLTALRLSLENIADGASDPAVQADIEIATAEVVRMSRLVDGLLALARAEAAVSAREPVRLAELIAARLDSWRSVAADRGVELRADCPDDALTAMATPGHLEQALDNVLSNALEVSPRGAVISVSAHRSRDYAVLDITDQGPGMSAAERARAFDRFWRGKGLTGPSGSGLGLAIAKQLINDNGGTVTLDDAAVGGLRVRIAVPVGP